MPLGEIKADAPAGVAQMRVLKPTHRLVEVRNAGIDLAGLYFPVATRPFRGRGIIRQGPERERFVAIFYASLCITLLNVCHSHAPQANHAKADIIESGPQFD